MLRSLVPRPYEGGGEGLVHTAPGAPEKCGASDIIVYVSVSCRSYTPSVDITVDPLSYVTLRNAKG